MKVFVEDSHLEIRLSIPEKIAGMHGSFKIPLSEIKETSTILPKSTLKEVRLPGTNIPGLVKAGTYLTSDGKEFWLTTKKQEYLIINLENNFYKKIVLSVDNNHGLKKEIDVCLNRRK